MTHFLEYGVGGEFQMTAVLKDSSRVMIRNLKTDDRSLLLIFLQHLSEEAISLRFSDATISKDAMIDQLLPIHGFALIALSGEMVVGHAAYHTTANDRAQVSVVVGDSYQNRGLGTILVEQLARAAMRAGVAVLEATVRPENVRMIDVIQRLGFKTNVRVEPGLIRLTFAASLQPEAVEAFDRLEATASITAVKNFLQPRGVAVIGASRDINSIGGRLFRNILEADFNGAAYPVNSGADVVQSVPAYHSVLDCPGPVDLAVVVVPAASVLGVAEECARKGVKALVVVSAGFSESGQHGAKLQSQLVEVCRKTGMRIIGPNCLGIINTDPKVGLNAQFSLYRPREGTIGFLTQSGALGIAVIDYANKLGLGLSSFVSDGNKADISGNDLVQYWESDDKTNVLLLYLESFGNPRKFARIAKRVAKRKPIIAVKSGRSVAGFRATQSHTGALVAASDVTVNALFRQSGVIRTDTLSEMFDVAALLSTQPIPKGNRVAIITNAGGAGILATDACEALGVKVPELSSGTQAVLKGFLRQQASVRNPVDMIGSATADDYSRTIRVVANDPEVDALIVIFVPPVALSTEEVAEAILASASELKGRIPILTTFMASHGISSLLTAGGIKIPSYPFPENAAAALAQAVKYGRWLSLPEGDPPNFSDVRKGAVAAVVASALLRKGEGWLTPEETETILRSYGIPHVASVMVKTPEEAERACSELGGRVALKAIAPGLLHKSDAGGVRLDLSPAEAKEAAGEMIRRVGSAGYSLSGFLVQPMVSGGVEMLVGVVYDSVFGPAVACGAGGVLAELLDDVAIRLTPLTDRDAEEMVDSLKAFSLLAGYRGLPTHDTKALKEIILRIGALVEDITEIAEIDLNPLMVLREGEGAVVVDARIRVTETVSPPNLGED